MKLERDLVDFSLSLRDRDIPPEARRRAVDAITDCAGCAVLGSGTPLAAAILETIHTGPECNGVLVGSSRKAPAADAALYNGAAAHALDYDDISHPAYSHPSAVLVPALLASATAAGATGRELVTAYVVGLEVFGKLGRTLNLEHYKQGWHATATFGAIAAAAAAARLLRLSAPQFLSALGLAASASGGLRCNFGTMGKPLHAGYAARNAVLAAQLARAGCDAAPDALTHKYGFFRVFNAGNTAREAQFSGWGAPFEILTESGIGLKLYPACAATHPAIEGAQRHRRKLDGDLSRIRRVRVGMSEFATEPLIYKVPKTPLQAKFSMHFCVAAALARDKVGLATYSEEAIAHAPTLEVLEKVETYVDERVRHDHEFAAVVTVETTDGRSSEERVDIAPGKPQRWFTREQLQDKFLDCCAATARAERARACFEQLQALDSEAPVAAVASALAEVNG